MKSAFVKTTLAALLSLTALASVSAQAGSVVNLRASNALKPQVMQVNPNALRPIKLQFNCVVQGTPVEFPNDIAISHNYNFTVPAGTKVAYVAPFGKSGVVTLPALAPGKVHYVMNVFPGGGPAGAPCSASQV